jgi:hypothetical protein
LSRSGCRLILCRLGLDPVLPVGIKDDEHEARANGPDPSTPTHAPHRR